MGELAANSAGYTHDAMDKLADALVDKLFSRVTSLGAPLGMAAPSTMAARPFLSSRQYFAAPQAGYQPQLSGTTTSVLAAIDVANRRDVSAKAKASVASGWSLVDDKVKERLVSVLDGVKEKESYLAGVSAPMNYFDPLGFSTTVDSGKLLFYREVELKHGRVAMLAALGFLVGEQYHPLFGGD